MFKFSAFLFALLVVKDILAITVEQKSQIQTKFIEAGAQCLKDHPLSADDLTALKDKKLPEGENGGCFMSCIFKHVGLIDESGNLSAAVAKNHAKEVFNDDEDLKNFEEFVTACDKVNSEEVSDGEKGCDRSKLAFTCLNDQSTKFGFNIEF